MKNVNLMYSFKAFKNNKYVLQVILIDFYVNVTITVKFDYIDINARIKQIILSYNMYLQTN